VPGLAQQEQKLLLISIVNVVVVVVDIVGIVIVDVRADKGYELNGEIT